MKTLGIILSVIAFASSAIVILFVIAMIQAEIRCLVEKIRNK